MVRTAIFIDTTVVIVAATFVRVRADTFAFFIASVWRRTITFTDFLAFIAHAFPAIATIIVVAAFKATDTFTFVAIAFLITGTVVLCITMDASAKRTARIV
jgi:hypothetical protein